MITLYQFPISHYCEKVRWALDYKNIPYKKINLLPGPHVKKITALADSSELPLIMHGNKIIQQSNEIINYLDATFPEQTLTPKNLSIKKQSLEWEAFVDKEVGPHLRRYFYHTLLKHPDIIIPIFSYDGPWYGTYFLKIIYPKLRKTMTRYMRLTDKSAEKSRQHLIAAMEKLNSHLSHQPFLAGDQFSRADLAAASLLAPILQPAKYGLSWPNPLPQPLQGFTEEWKDQLSWVQELYTNYR